MLHLEYEAIILTQWVNNNEKPMEFPAFTKPLWQFNKFHNMSGVVDKLQAGQVQIPAESKDLCLSEVKYKS